MTTATMEITLMSSDGPEIQVQQRYIGHQPAVYIEPEMDEDENIIYNVLAVDVESKEELAQLFEGMAQILREGEESDSGE